MRIGTAGRSRSRSRACSVRHSELGPFDIILSAGADWNTKDPDAISTLKSQTGFRFVMVCYDLIPVLSPQFYSARDATVFAHYFRAALGFADRFICISQRTARDLAEFAVAQGHYDADICTERLGADAIGQAGGSAPLPAGLASERYVLFVSTIEPRKNHALLLRVWRRLAAGEHGGTAGFKLVFAGRPGWMTQDIVVALSRETVFKRDVLHIPSASDPELDALFEHAAFTVYPSHYEGFGLPVIESLAHGTPAIVSSAGSLPEAVAGLGPCVDPTDDDGWAAAMGRWINDPAQLAEQARRIRAEFSWPSWSDAAGRILDACPRSSGTRDRASTVTPKTHLGKLVRRAFRKALVQSNALLFTRLTYRIEKLRVTDLGQLLSSSIVAIRGGKRFAEW